VQEPAFRSYTDFMRRGDQSPFFAEIRVADGSPLSLGVAHLPAGEHPDPAVPELVISCLLSGSGTAETDFGAGRRRHVVAPGHLAVVAPGTPARFGLGFGAKSIVLALSATAVVCTPPLSPAQRPRGLSRGSGRRRPVAARMVACSWNGAVLTLIGLLHRAEGRREPANDRGPAGLPDWRLIPGS
jgi:hypothetical protein